MNGPTLAPSCLSEEQLRAMAEGSLDDAESGRLELHLADCDTCRGRWIAESQAATSDMVPVEVPAALRRQVDALVSQGPASQRSKSPKTWNPWTPWAARWIWAPALTVLALVIFQQRLPLGSPIVDPPPDERVLRGERNGALSQLTPAEDHTLQRGQAAAVTFAWQFDGEVAGFVFELVDSLGQRLLTSEGMAPQQTADLSSLAAGDYFWTVRVQSADGSTSRSSPRRLRLIE